MITAASGTILIFSDIACPWAHLSVHRLWATREQLGLLDDVRLDHRAFPLEIFNERATPKRALDAEIPVVGGLDPDAGWHTWDRQDWEYPGSTLLALESVQAAKRQSLAAGEEMDRGLRQAFFRDRRNITLRHEVLMVAEASSQVDRAQLEEDLDTGVARRDVIDQHREASSAEVQGSPHLFFPDGSSVHNPGIQMHLAEGGFPVVDKDDREIYADLLQRAAQSD